MVTPREVRHLRRAAGVTKPDEEHPPVVVPANVVEFASSPEFLNVELYPKQATLLKIFTLAVEALTEFDRRVIAEWCRGFARGDDEDAPRFVGSYGIAPDVMERIAWCRAEAQPWFREIVLVLGRRGSKNFVASILVLWRLWHLLALGDPQRHYGLPLSKKLAVHVFGTDVTTLTRNGYSDIAGLLRDAPCFAPFLGAETRGELTLLTPRQLADGARQRFDPGLVSVVAAATTTTSGRGPAAPVLLFDEFAFVQGMGSTATSAEIYSASTPAVMQFGNEALIIQTSSPWDKVGQLYTSYERGLAIDAGTGAANDPGTFVAQLPSWELYTQDEPAETIPMWPNGPTFPTRAPMITEAQVMRLREQGHDTAVEYEAQFAVAGNAYLREDKVRAIFQPWNGRTLTTETSPPLNRRYVAHADPSRSNANFAFAIAHLERDEEDQRHVVFDLLHAWRPQDFVDHVVDYVDIEAIIFDHIHRFRIAELTFDQYSSTQSIQQLNRRAQFGGLSPRPHIHQRVATASFNFQAAEIFKTAVNNGLVHAPPHDLAAAELSYLVVNGTRVSHPGTGPVVTDDLADCMINVTYTLLHEDTSELFQHLGGLSLRGGPGVGRAVPIVDDPGGALAALGRRRRRGTGYIDPSRGGRRRL